MASPFSGDHDRLETSGIPSAPHPEPAPTLQPVRGGGNIRQSFPWWLQVFLLVGTLEAMAIGASNWLAPEGSLARRLLPVAGGAATYASVSDPATDPTYIVPPSSSGVNPVSVRSLNGRVIGAFYLAGAVGLVTSFLTRRAHDARIFVFGFGFIAGSLLILTFAYWSAFTADHVPYGWLVSYLVDPLVAGAAIATLGLVRPAASGKHRWSGLFLAEAMVLGVTGFVLLLLPGIAATLWPWTLTPVLARVYACFFLGFALGGVLAAGETRVAAIRPFALASAVLALFVLIGSLRDLDRFKSGVREWGWFGAFGLLGVLCVAALLTLMRADHPTREAC